MEKNIEQIPPRAEVAPETTQKQNETLELRPHSPLASLISQYLSHVGRDFARFIDQQRIMEQPPFSTFSETGKFDMANVPAISSSPINIALGKGTYSIVVNMVPIQDEDAVPTEDAAPTEENKEEGESNG